MSALTLASFLQHSNFALIDQPTRASVKEHSTERLQWQCDWGFRICPLAGLRVVSCSCLSHSASKTDA